MAKKELAYWKSIIITLVLMVSGWAVFSMAKLGVEGLLLKWGVSSEFWQFFVIIAGAIIILAVLGFGVKSAFDKVMGK